MAPRTSTTPPRWDSSAAARSSASALSPRAESRSPDRRRLRSEGPLDPETLEIYKAQGIPLAYDPVQIGWVPANCLDDFLAEPEEDIDAGTARILDRGTHRSGWRTVQPARAVDARAAAVDTADTADTTGHDGERTASAPGPECLLRPWQESDARRFVELLDDPRVWRYLPEEYPNPLDESMARALIELSNVSGHHEVRAIECDGEIVGQVRMLFVGRHHGQEGQPDAEISYWLGAPYWGRGIIREVIPLYTTLSFRKHPDLISIFARVHEANQASRRALERAGYRLDDRPHAAGSERDPSIRTYRAFREAFPAER